MANANLNTTILKPIITESSLADQSLGRYHFWVGIKSTKNQIVSAFKKIFSVTPLKINTLIIKGKVKTDWKRRQPIAKSDRKKAIITIPKDQKIEILTVKTK
ncbi:MAG: 50S ribosomal protein L23 [Candidatus Shapirobacteria bacterium]|jgi:large subunit ribosomal protein L23